MNAAIDGRVLGGERRYLYSFAMTRLRDADLAEDAVQETMMAALQALPRFEGRSALRTWLTAILRNKIADLVKVRSREVLMGDDEPEAEAWDEDGEALFDRDGHWEAQAAPRHWGNPEASAEKSEFWKVFEACLKELPPRTAEVFYLREVVGESVEDICAKLGITENNCSVMLFRARGKLRAGLESRWFGRSGN